MLNGCLVSADIALVTACVAHTGGCRGFLTDPIMALLGDGNDSVSGSGIQG